MYDLIICKTKLLMLNKFYFYNNKGAYLDIEPKSAICHTKKNNFRTRKLIRHCDDAQHLSSCTKPAANMIQAVYIYM